METSLCSCLVFLALAYLTVCYPTSSSTGHYGPVFEEQPVNTLFPEGSTEEKVTLNCQARASPPATYRWKLNGTEVKIESDSRYTLMGGNLVVMNPTKAQDAGTYQCVAANSIGSVVSKEAFLRFGYLQEFPTEERDPIKVTEGAGAILTCSPPPHYPGLSYRWLKNEFPNFISLDDRRFVSMVTGNLYFAKTKASDMGLYSCFTTSHIDFVTKSVFSKFMQLNVLSEGEARTSAPSIKAKFAADTYALAGQTMNLECFAFGNPVPRIKWRKVDGTLPSKWKVTEPVLQIPNIGFDDEGTYECEAENQRGKDTYHGRIIVQAQPEWLDIISDTEADIGSDLRWTCAAAGKPRPTVRWLRNGQLLTSQDRVHVNNGELRISKLTLDDSGMFQCIAENKHGTTYATAELKVFVLAPDFRSNPMRKLIPAARGGEVLIECKPRAAPKPSVFWSKGTEILINSTRVTIYLDGSLKITNITRSDEGKYTCFAENSMGKANSTGTLSVRDATKITLAPSNADINLGENVTLQCHASHDSTMDLTFTWSLDRLPIDFDRADGHYQRVTANEAVGDLTILDAQLKHSGRYTCTAQTVVDSTSASASLIIRGPPGPPGGVVVKDISETSVQLSWSRGYDNHSPIGKYIIEAKSLISNKWKQVKTDLPAIEGNAETARVINLTPWMDYEFRVIATNILGVGDPSMPSSTIRTKAAAPTVAPSGLSGGGGDQHELIIKWTPMLREYQNGDGFGYILKFRKKDTEVWMTAKVPNAESSRYVYHNTTIDPYCPFEVKIKGYNRKGEGPYGQITVVHSAEEEPSVAPSEVKATSISASEIAVSWAPIEEVTMNGKLLGYEIRYWREGDNEAAADRVRTPGLEISARISGLKPSTLYLVAVRAYNSAGTGPASPSTKVTTKKAPPSQPPGNVTWKLQGSTVTIKWNHVKATANESAVRGYKILCKPTEQEWKHYSTIQHHIQIPLPEDADYVVVEIRAFSEGGDGAPAEVVISKNTGM
ncbi:contactin-2 [Latimeria chalumnae]|uniref:contactin-2 n=1 Tax=Latimeria chalumnae TaxID=7897 RepID=UPI0003C0FC19|nr:PREDICTED: contactin-2 [Latimeria chalumnae]|eukprot:XP_005989277.1 PREDICTED: contactin-2 [Latimeria chalumnae]